MGSGTLRPLVAWSLIAVGAAATVMSLLHGSVLGEGLVADVFFFLAMFGLVLVGALIVQRRSGNRVGWMMMLAGSFFLLAIWAEGYATHAHAASGDPPGIAVWAAWLSNWFFLVPIALLFVGLPLLFPDGRLPSSRWRPLGWMVVVQFSVLIVLYAVRPGPMSWDGGEGLSDNPLGVEPLEPVVDGMIAAVEAASVLVLIAIVVAGSVRWRRSRGVERQQMKWFLSAVAALAAYAILQSLFTIPVWTFGIAMSAVPVAVGMAILRYRLYDIDRIVSRTVSYALLSALLAGTYAIGVVGLGSVARATTGTQADDLVVAGSTLLVAALFGPARRRTQKMVDRQFRRRRYDATRTVQEFGYQLRDQIDLERIGGELTRVAGQTLQPSSVGLWLRPELVSSPTQEG